MEVSLNWWQERGINMLFVLGGNGTHVGANAIHNEVTNLVHIFIWFAITHAGS